MAIRISGYIVIYYSGQLQVSAFTFRGQRLWNSLPDEFQFITNLDVFKVKIKQHFLRVVLEN